MMAEKKNTTFGTTSNTYGVKQHKTGLDKMDYTTNNKQLLDGDSTETCTIDSHLAQPTLNNDVAAKETYDQSGSIQRRTNHETHLSYEGNNNTKGFPQQSFHYSPPGSSDISFVTHALDSVQLHDQQTMITPPSPDLPSYSTHSNDEDIVDFNLCDSDDDVFIQNYLTNQRFTMFDMGPNFNQHYIPATLNYRMQSERHQNENTVSQQLRRIDRRLQLFICDPTRSEYQLPIMSTYCQRQIQGLCTMYKLKINKLDDGNGVKRAPIVRKGPKTHLPQDRYAIEKYISKVRTLYKAKRQMERKPGGSASNSVRQAKREERGTAKPKKYRVVGGDASPLSGSNIGHRMLANMGWKEGDSLGVNKDGMAEPIQVVIQSNRRGLGA